MGVNIRRASKTCLFNVKVADHTIISDLYHFFAKATPLNLTLILKILDPDVKYEVTCAAGDIAT